MQRGKRYFHAGKLTEALADAEKALTINPTNTNALLLRGKVKKEIKCKLTDFYRGELISNKAITVRRLTNTTGLGSNTMALDLDKTAIASALVKAQQAETENRAKNTVIVAAAPVQGNNAAQSPLWNKISALLKPTNPFRKEIDDLAAELKTNTAAPAREKEIFNRIEQNSTKILSAVNEALTLIGVEPESADKTFIKKKLDADVAAMKRFDKVFVTLLSA